MAHKERMIPIRLTEDNYEIIKSLAAYEHRSIANMLNQLVEVAGMDWDNIKERDRQEKLAVKAHIVQEGKDLGIL